MDNCVFTAPGRLVAVNGTHFHVRSFGQSGPPLVLECGMTMMSACWGWLAPELARGARVIAYDRAGLGWSDLLDSPRDAGTLAGELTALLKSLRINEPILLLGHSMGALFNRGYILQNPGTVGGVVWLDPAHPDQMKRRSIRRRIRHFVFYIEAARLLARRGVPAIDIPLVRHLEGLPVGDYAAIRRFMRNPTHLQTSAREARAWDSSAELADRADLRAIPLLVVSGQKSALPHWGELQADLARVSEQSRHRTFPGMSHLSMLANQDHAATVAAEIHSFIEGCRL